MFYKVMKDDRILDVLDQLHYVKYHEGRDAMIACGRNLSQAVLASDKSNFWHIYGQYPVPVDGYDTVMLVEIDQEEYEQLKSQIGKVV